jgi:hypothetical protein
MDTPAATATVKINRFLPYWAVFQVDVRQTCQNWVYRTWVLVSLLAGVGYLLYRMGVFHEAGMMQRASALISDLLRWTLLGSVALIGVLTASCISGERGTMADSVLSRGISRYQYFLAKWHARLAVVLGTFVLMAALSLTSSFFLLQGDLSLLGSMVAVASVAVLLAAVVTCGVTVSAISNSTVLGISVLWLLLYGAGFVLSLLPVGYPTPDRVLTSLPHILQGYYDLEALGRLAAYSAGVCGGVALVGLGYFARRDV